MFLFRKKVVGKKKCDRDVLTYLLPAEFALLSLFFICKQYAFEKHVFFVSPPFACVLGLYVVLQLTIEVNEGTEHHPRG